MLRTRSWAGEEPENPRCASAGEMAAVLAGLLRAPLPSVPAPVPTIGETVRAFAMLYDLGK